MSCFDRDHRVVVQRRSSAGNVPKPGQSSTQTSTAPVLAPGPSGPPVKPTPRVSKTVRTNSTIKLKNLKERLSDDDSLAPEQKLELEIGELRFFNHNLRRAIVT